MEKKNNFFEKFWYLFVGLAVILILIIASLWFFNQKTINEQKALRQMEIENAAKQELLNKAAAETITPTPAETDIQTLQLENQGSSDEIADIEKDLTNTNLDTIDQEKDTIDQELNNL